jgi:hypothetical protein
VLLTVGITLIPDLHIGEVDIHFSSLLTCMMMGTMFCNLCDFSEELMDRLDRWTAPIFILFFVLSGAKFEFTMFSDILIVIVGIVYIVFRSLGKYFGARASAMMVKAPPTVKKYLGITLLPQAGVALGMALTAGALAEYGGTAALVGSIVSNVALFSVLIYELVGPFFTKIALSKAGEIDPEGKSSARGKRIHEHNHK